MIKKGAVSKFKNKLHENYIYSFTRISLIQNSHS